MPALALLVSLIIRKPAAPQMAVRRIAACRRIRGRSTGMSNTARLSMTKLVTATSNREPPKALQALDWGSLNVERNLPGDSNGTPPLRFSDQPDRCGELARNCASNANQSGVRRLIGFDIEFQNDNRYVQCSIVVILTAFGNTGGMDCSPRKETGQFIKGE